MTYNEKQGLLTVVAKQLRVLPNDVTFQKKQNYLNKRRRSDDCLR